MLKNKIYINYMNYINKLPENIVNSIILESIILEKNKNWKKIHMEILKYKKKSIKCIITINNIMYKTKLHFYNENHNIITLPKLKSGERFYSIHYIYRLTNIHWNDIKNYKSFFLHNLVF